MQNYIDLVNGALYEHLCPKYPHVVYEAMGYSVLGGGKRVRPLLLMSTCTSLGGDIEVALPFACAVEMLHAYSLIHDDLPAMDNDDYRRGKYTNHKVYGEAIAILAGDGLLNLAYEIMVDYCYNHQEPWFIAAMREIALAVGVQGMVGGQVADITSENKVIDEETLTYIHKNKTGAIFRGAVCAGAHIGGKLSDSQFEKIRQAAADFGFAFQIKDDLLDVQSTQEVLGKPILSDERNQKTTYVSMYGVEKAERDYHEYSRRAIAILEEIPFENRRLITYIESLLNRQY